MNFTLEPNRNRRNEKGEEEGGGRKEGSRFSFRFLFNDTTAGQKYGRKEEARRIVNRRRELPCLPSRVHSPLDVSARVTVTKRRTVSALSGSLHRPPFRPFPSRPSLRPATRDPYPLPSDRRDAIQPAAYCVFVRRHIAARCYTRNGPLVGGDGALVGDKYRARGGGHGDAWWG